MDYTNDFWGVIKWNLLFVFIIQSLLFLIVISLSKLKFYIYSKLNSSKSELSKFEDLTFEDSKFVVDSKNDKLIQMEV